MSFRPFALIAFVSLICGPIASAANPYWIVSDVDDTVKQTNVLNRPAAVVNGIFRERAFFGMALLYQRMASRSNVDAPMVFLSGSPFILDHHIRKTLDDAGFPAFQLFLRDLTSGPTPQYKRNVLEQLTPRSEGSDFILLGDDGEKDPETLTGYAAAHPGKVPRVYIHRIVGRAIPEGITEFHTAFEVALSEFNDGRLTENDAAFVGEAIADVEDPTDVFPGFVECPASISYPTSPSIAASSKLTDLIARNAAKWSAYCGSRR